MGDTFGAVREVDRYRALYYAAASGDFNPIHVDPEVGAQAGLGGAILHGLCTLSFGVDVAVKYLGDPGCVRSVKARFSRPVAIGDTLTFEGRVIQINGARLKMEVAARNQRGEEVLKGLMLEAEPRLAAGASP